MAMILERSSEQFMRSNPAGSFWRPGIEEEYGDALAAIADLRRALGERPLTNDTPDGRVLLEVAWV